MSTEASPEPMQLHEWYPLDRRVVTWWRATALANVALVTVLLAVGEAIVRRSQVLDDVPVALVPAVVGALGLVAAIVWPGAAYRRWRFRLSEHAVELHHGVVVRRSSSVPYHRVQQIDLAQGPLERTLGLTRAVITTAAATTDGAVPGLRAQAAETFRHMVLERTGRDDAV